MGTTITIDPVTATAVAAVVAIVLQVLKQSFIDPLKIADTQRNALLRALNFLLNLGAVMLLAVAAKSFDWSNSLSYISLAVAQAGGAHLAFKVLSSDPSPAAAAAAATPVSIQLPPVNSSTVTLSDPGIGNVFPTIPRPDLPPATGPNV
jgi:hypothetical protein